MLLIYGAIIYLFTTSFSLIAFNFKSGKTGRGLFVCNEVFYISLGLQLLKQLQCNIPIPKVLTTLVSEYFLSFIHSRPDNWQKMFCGMEALPE